MALHAVLKGTGKSIRKPEKKDWISSGLYAIYRLVNNHMGKSPQPQGENHDPGH